jgi:sugar/nucleoside kinase (ribokinase family)
MPDVVCVGILVADVVGKPVDSLPVRGKLQLAEQMELHTGGCAVNTAVALAKIGVSTAGIGKVGEDGFGDFMVSALAGQGIETSGVARTSLANTSATMVMVHSDGERSFIHYLGANAEFRDDDVDFTLVKQSRVAHIGGSFLMPAFDGAPTADLLRRARAAGVTTSLDTAWDSRGGWMQVLAPCLPHLDYFIPSIEEARMITGEKTPESIASSLIDRGVGTVGLKMGADGCFVQNREITLRIAPHPVPVVDALGAGDSFAAGFLTGIVKGWDLEKTARFANAVGALSVTALGASTGIRTLEETLSFMEHGL